LSHIRGFQDPIDPSVESVGHDPLQPSRRTLLKGAAAAAAGGAALTFAGTRGVVAQESPPKPQPPAISAAYPFESKFATVLGSEMHYVEMGEGDPILFLHGNPTSSYLWRNVIPHVSPMGRAIAVDNIGFGKSAKPDIDYTFVDHSGYVDGFIETLGLKNLTLVVHDWGSALGLYHAARHSENVKGVVFMEALIPPVFPMKSYADMGPFEPMFRAFRDPIQGPQMIVENNFFIEQMLPSSVMRTLSAEEMTAYREPFLDPVTRKPILVWPNQVPIEGTPADTVKVVEEIGQWLMTSRTPKLLQYASPGAIIPPPVAGFAAQNFPNIETQFVGYGLHFIQEDNPEAIGRGIADWYRRLA
jgi:haloalkane dehalogenase